MGDALYDLGRVALARGAWDAPISPLELPAHTQLAAAARVALGEDAFATAWMQGQSATLTQLPEQLTDA